MLAAMEKLISNAGTRIWTASAGQGAPLILCNGGPGCDDYLQPVSALIEDLCQVVRFEPRGCGRSDYDGNYDLDTTVTDIEHLRQAWGFEEIMVSGHSAGCDVALAYALRYPGYVRGLIGIAGGRIVNDREWSQVYKANLENRGEDYGGKVFVADPEVNRRGNASWKKFIQHPELLAAIAALPMPAIYIWGTDDIRPAWPTRQLANLIPNGAFFEIDGAAHCIWLTHSEELKRLLRQAVSTILDQSAGLS